jgi:Peptidase family C25
MKKIILSIFAFFFTTTVAFSQLNNSWIDYSKTYYKFPLAKDTLCRINQTVLAAAGLGAVPAENFQLWRNGKQVRIYTSLATGVLGANDYIEFWGEMNDGKPDNNLYRNPASQLSEKFSLETDTAIYFLTVNTSSANNLRYVQSPNIIAGNTLPASPYFMRKIEQHYRNIINKGYAAVIGEYVFSSSYDIGEGWSSVGVGPGSPLSKDFTGLNRYAAGPPNSVTFTIGASGYTLYARDLVCRFYSTPVLQTPMPFFDYVKDTVRNLPLSLLLSPTNLPVSVGTTSSNPNEGMVVSNFSVTYPATFNFNNEKNFYFDLEPSATGNYLKIANFNHNGQQPILYDYTNGKRYFGDISITDTVQFVLPASSQLVRKFNLMSQASGNVSSISTLTSKNFIDYTAAANRGDYLIISNPVLYNDGSGVNNVELYRQYRSSANGGGYTAKTFDINELTDQFAFGIKKHPAAVRDFIRYVNQQYTVKPKYLFIIGRAISYADYTINQNNPVANQIDLVQTFGYPASDILLVAEPGTQIPLVPVGRLGAVNGTEVGIYLNKMIEYEQAQKSPEQTINAKGWMKNVLQTGGPANVDEAIEFAGYLETYKRKFEDTLYGGSVSTYIKSSTVAIEQQQSREIEAIMNGGVGVVKYFGHSSANDLAVNLNFPQNYTNAGKYPFMHVSGCTVGNFFTYNPLRPTGFAAMSLSEKYTFLPNKGSIGFLGSTHWGIAPFLNFYNLDLINNVTNTMYGQSIGDQLKSTITSLGSSPSTLDYYTRVHLEEINLQGDPALKINNFPKPDYIIEDQLVKLNPTIITVADASFTIDIKMRNIGRAIGDSIRVTVKHKLPNDDVRVLYDKVIRSIKNIDSVFLTETINPITDKGLNKLIITLDDGNRIDEISENNNILIKEFYIFEDELRPVSPYNYSIINQQNITYYANTANPLGSTRQYVMEIDTTKNFNSIFKKVYNANGVGGVIEFKPTNLTFTDSTVYYWRVAVVPLNNTSYIWNNSSFVYIANSTTGFNQSHYYQYKNNTYQDIVLDDNRVFNYTPKVETFAVKTTVFPASNQIPDFALLKGAIREQAGFYTPFTFTNSEGLRFYVIDSVTLKAVKNIDNGTSGLFGSVRPLPLGNSVPGFFHFRITTLAERQNVMTFLDAVSNGNTIVMTNGPANPFTFFPSSWRADTIALGSGNSLYHKLKNMGWTYIDSLKTLVPFVFITKKGTNIPSNQTFGLVPSEKLAVQFDVLGRNLSGEYTSDKLGPAKTWQDLRWRGNSVEPLNTDNSSVEVIGVDANGNNTSLAIVRPAQDTSLSWINATQYPYLKLRMITNDSSQGTPMQLRYWRINATMLPEGAVAPNILYAMKDTVEQGEKIDFKLAFKNISQTAFDSTMKFNFIITDRNNVTTSVPIPRGKVLVAGDTLTINSQIDTKNLPGSNTLFVDVNPNNHQPEQTHFNNILFKDFYVKADTYNPLLDVTFDGVHILNKDIVAAKPHILINLKDESRFLALADTALLKVQVRFPDGSLQQYYFGDIMVFTPANLATGKNTATIDFMPKFDEEGEYELIVMGRDVVGNKAGDLEYHINFNVITKAMISNLLNYPNPFTTFTAFVFTITGNEVPQNMRIQILTITGKIVREITKDELGPIHVGRNITEFKWDGTDTYGQKLGNGVYLYRVLTNLNGKSLEKYKADGDKTDQYFNKGYGKMVIIR